MRSRIIGLFCALLSGGLMSCGAGSVPSSEVPSSQQVESRAAAETPESGLLPLKPARETAPKVPETLAGEHLLWLLEVLNSKSGEVSVEDLAVHLTPQFLKAVGVPQIQGLMKSLAQQAPYLLRAIEQSESRALTVVAQTNSEPVRIVLSLQPEAELVAGLRFAPALDYAAAIPKTWKAVEKQITDLAPQAQYLVAEVLKSGACLPLHGYRHTERLALGSSFKLYVLAALAEKIQEGKRAWDEKLVVSNKLKSLPSGRLQNAPDGTEITLQEAAELMISISDNTATDHLIEILGRSTVEDAMGKFGHGQPELNQPLLTTRELFLFKLNKSEAEVASYIKLSVAQRREYLRQLAGKFPDLSSAESWENSRYIDSLEWFASGDEMCGVMAGLERLARADSLAPLLGVLAKNPGLILNASAFPYLGYKGGSEPGVLNMTWLARSRTNRWYVVEVGFNNPDSKVDPTKALLVAAGIFSLLEKQLAPTAGLN